MRKMKHFFLIIAYQYTRHSIYSQASKALLTMSAIDQIRAILASNPDIEIVELKDVIRTCVKTKRTSAIQKDMRALVKDHDKTTLARLRKELKIAFAEVHKDDEESDATPAPETAYRKFVKEQTALMKEEDMWKDAPQALRMVEIGKRWKTHKQQAALAEAAGVQLPNDDENEPTPAQAPTPRRQNKRATTNGGASTSRSARARS